MKSKAVALFLSLGLAGTLTACLGNNEAEGEAEDTVVPTAPNAQDAETEQEEEEESEGGEEGEGGEG